jgi:phytoene dehydrogenase-like protein
VQASLLAAGGTVLTGQRVSTIVCDGDHVDGVETESGERIAAPVVISACDPHATFLQWLRDPPPRARSLVERWRATPHHDGYESKIDAVVTEVPAYRQLPDWVATELDFDPMAATAVIAPPAADLVTGHRRSLEGQVMTRPVMLANFPTVLDPAMSPSNRHVLSLEALYTPFALRGGWPHSTEPQRWLEQYATLLKGPFLDTLVDWRVMTPDRYESEFHLPRGHAASFAGGPLAVFRPSHPELVRYRTALRGLYLTGAATFPGAGVWGASGRNCASVVLSDPRPGKI